MSYQSVQAGDRLPRCRYADYNILFSCQLMQKNFETSHQRGYQRAACPFPCFFYFRDQLLIQREIKAVTFVRPHPGSWQIGRNIDYRNKILVFFKPILFYFLVFIRFQKQLLRNGIIDK